MKPAIKSVAAPQTRTISISTREPKRRRILLQRDGKRLPYVMFKSTVSRPALEHLTPSRGSGEEPMPHYSRSPSMPEANRECATDLADVLHAAMEARRAERSRGRVTVYKPSRLRLRTASRLDYSGFTKLR